MNDWFEHFLEIVKEVADRKYPTTEADVQAFFDLKERAEKTLKVYKEEHPWV